MKFDLVTPVKLLASETAAHVRVSGSEGDFGVLPGHAPLISTLRPGAIIVNNDNKETIYFVGNGFVDVNPKSVTIIAEEAELKENIDVKAAKAKLADAEKTLKSLLGDESKTAEYVKAAKAKAIFEAKIAVANS